MSETRDQEHVIEIEAPVEAVWKALTDAEEVVRWYAPEARVTPEEGGAYWVSWGEGMAGEARIDVFEPNRRLRLVPKDLPIVQEYFLEARGDVTVLRLVQSEVPTSSEWDDFYEDTKRGWKMFFIGLRHYLERHLGQPRESIAFMHPVDIPVEEAWKKLIGPEGLAGGDELERVPVGGRESFTTPFGQKLDVELLMREPPRTLSMTIDNLQDSLLALDFESVGGKTFLYANLSTFGVPEDRVDTLKTDWKAWLDRLFPLREGSTT